MSRRFKFKAELFLIGLSQPDSFEPDKFLKGSYTNTRVLGKKSLEQAEYLYLIGREHINIQLLGEKALAAWIPARDSLVRVGRLAKQFPAGKEVAFIEERNNDAPPIYEGGGGIV